VASTPPICDFGWKARDFRLSATDGKSYSLADLRGPKGTLIAFICNHCPYVQAITGLLVRDANDLAKAGIGVAAICANDAKTHPEDSFANMKVFAKANGFPFPYLHDESQEIARAYGAICTPDFFGFNSNDELQYRGRLDASRMSPVAGAKRDLYEAICPRSRARSVISTRRCWVWPAPARGPRSRSPRWAAPSSGNPATGDYFLPLDGALRGAVAISKRSSVS
jgi:peroxiredoxin